MKISFKNNAISISQKLINLQVYGGINQFLFIAQDEAALDFFVPENVGDFAFAYVGEGLINVYEYVSSGGGFWSPIDAYSNFTPANFSDWSNITRYYDTASSTFHRAGLNVITNIHVLETLTSSNNYLVQSNAGLLGSIPSTFDLYLKIPSLYGASIRLIKNGTALSIPTQFSGTITNISNTEVTFSNGNKITKDTLSVKTTSTSTTGQIDWESKVLWAEKSLGFKDTNGFIKLTDITLTLFAFGDQKTSLTGGWVAGLVTGGGSVSIGTQLVVVNTSSGQRSIVTDIKVSKPFHAKFLKVRWSASGSSNVRAFLAISTGATKNFTPLDATASVASPFYSFSSRVDTLDISSIQNDFYISIIGQTTSTSTGTVSVDEIWFEE